MMESTLTLFPDPLSPTIPSASPGCKKNETPFTALMSPSRVEKIVFNSFTSNKILYSLRATINRSTL
jgi:hypothetical protein